MTDPENDPADSPGENPSETFDDASYADISALLAGARETGPVPAGVAARLDATLADLTADRRTEADLAAEVVPLAHRRRLATRLLAAAAAVAVLGGAGVGLTQVLDNRSNDSLTRSAAGDGAASSPAAAPGTALAPSLPTSSADAGELKGLDNLALGYAARVPVFTTAGFATQAARYVTRTSPLAGSLDDRADAGGQTTTTPSASPDPAQAPVPGTAPAQPPGAATAQERTPRSGTAAKAACTPPADPGGTVTPITFDRQPATLVVHPAVSGNQLVQAWSCDGSTVLATAVLAR